MLLMLDTSQSLIGPCGPLEQWPSGDNSRHASMALLSSGVDCGEKPGVRPGCGLRQAQTVGLSSK